MHPRVELLLYGWSVGVPGHNGLRRGFRLRFDRPFQFALGVARVLDSTGRLKDNGFGGDDDTCSWCKRRHHDHSGIGVEFEYGDANRDIDHRCRWSDADYIAGTGERLGHVLVLFNGRWFAYHHGDLFGQHDLCGIQRVSERDGDCGGAGGVKDNGFGGDDDTCSWCK
jgi:hypothetical protein